MTDMEKVLQKIEKLFKLSKSPNEAEATAALEKAHAMLKEYNLSTEDIKEKPDVRGHCVKDFGKEMRWKSILLQGVASAHYCTLIVSKQRGLYSGTYRLFGQEHNVRMAMVMYEYLESTVQRMVRRAARTNEYILDFNANSFRQGMALRLATRLEEMKEQDTAESTALMVINTESEQAARRDCPNLKNRNITAKTDASASAGYQAAEDVSLNRQLRGTGTRMTAGALT